MARTAHPYARIAAPAYSKRPQPSVTLVTHASSWRGCGVATDAAAVYGGLWHQDPNAEPFPASSRKGDMPRSFLVPLAPGCLKRAFRCRAWDIQSSLHGPPACGNAVRLSCRDTPGDTRRPLADRSAALRVVSGHLTAASLRALRQDPTEVAVLRQSWMPRGDPPRPGRTPGRCWSAPDPIGSNDRGHREDQPHH